MLKCHKPSTVIYMMSWLREYISDMLIKIYEDGSQVLNAINKSLDGVII
mgnify:CR=1 FL=1